MPDIKPPTIQPTEPRMTRDQAAAAWFLFLVTTEQMLTGGPGPSTLIGRACLMTAKSTAEKIRRCAPRVIQRIIDENAGPDISL